jgi:hypothetical protein
VKYMRLKRSRAMITAIIAAVAILQQLSANDSSASFLVVGAPEPATYSLMLGAGFLLVGAMFRRRKTR